MTTREYLCAVASGARYDSPEPVEKTLQSFAVNLTNNPSVSQLLDQVRGERVEVTLKDSGPARRRP